MNDTCYDNHDFDDMIEEFDGESIVLPNSGPGMVSGTSFGSVDTGYSSCILNQLPILDQTDMILLEGSWDINDNVPKILNETDDSDYVLVDDLSQVDYFNNRMTIDNGRFDNNLNLMNKNFVEPDINSYLELEMTWIINYKIDGLLNGIEYEATGNDEHSRLEKYKRKKYNKQNKLENISGPNRNNGNVNVLNNGGSKKLTSHAKHSNAKTKPPFTYTELIEHALTEKGELTVSGIYKWISEHYPYYDMNDDRWKNSVRHNLSISPHFRKGGKTGSGAGHLWTTLKNLDLRNKRPSNEKEPNILKATSLNQSIKKQKSANHVKREYKHKEKKADQSKKHCDVTNNYGHINSDYVNNVDDSFLSNYAEVLEEEEVTEFSTDNQFLNDDELINTSSNFDEIFHDDQINLKVDPCTFNYKVDSNSLQIDNCDLKLCDNIFES